MGFQNFRFSVPKQTDQASPFRQDYKILEPVIESIVVKIPEGHKDSCELEINSPGFFHIMAGVRGDNETKNSGTINIRLFGPHYYINCVGWNSSVFLSHDFIIEVNTHE